ncbi:YceI family protein [Falsihalocynthiibacter sp. BN13B15]|uniref:YceI family protein n=1 Tax=Falsihalocynthiibacter sp. BN13B15 TaxID=3240871 RepID=UPI00350ED16E
MNKFFRTLVMGLFVLAAPVRAAPLPYDMDTQHSKVSFSYSLEGLEFSGSFPDFSTKLILDFDSVSKSTVDVTLNARTVRGGIIFATDALRGPEVLDVAKFPIIRFTSTKIDTVGQSVRIRGNMTIKDVTRPMTLLAKLYRAPDSNPDEQDNLTIRISGQINRNAFNVVGYDTLVGSVIKINVTAQIRKRQ